MVSDVVFCVQFEEVDMVVCLIVSWMIDVEYVDEVFEFDCFVDVEIGVCIVRQFVGECDVDCDIVVVYCWVDMYDFVFDDVVMCID